MSAKLSVSQLLQGARKGLAVLALAQFSLFSPLASNVQAQEVGKASTPIKHVIIIVGENRSFDHLFATYVPKSKDERVRNLLSEHIINADGTPGPKFARAHQFQITAAPNGGKFFSSA